MNLHGIKKEPQNADALDIIGAGRKHISMSSLCNHAFF
jgi:hypothetical protein